jgi:tRNA-dihydrouridine synthase
VIDELQWTIDRAVEHLGEPRATRYLRKFYPWYLERLELAPGAARSLQAALQSTEQIEHARRLLEAHRVPHARASAALALAS